MPQDRLEQDEQRDERIRQNENVRGRSAKCAREIAARAVDAQKRNSVRAHRKSTKGKAAQTATSHDWGIEE
jgi:hypothetical protein